MTILAPTATAFLPELVDSGTSVHRFLLSMLRDQQVEHHSGYFDHAADLVQRAIVVAASMWAAYSDNEVQGVRLVLVDQMDVYNRLAWTWRNKTEVKVSADERAARAEVLNRAAAEIAKILRALETQFAAQS